MLGRACAKFKKKLGKICNRLLSDKLIKTKKKACFSQNLLTYKSNHHSITHSYRLIWETKHKCILLISMKISF